MEKMASSSLNSVREGAHLEQDKHKRTTQSRVVVLRLTKSLQRSAFSAAFSFYEISWSVISFLAL